jgi:hypothetical protein
MIRIGEQVPDLVAEARAVPGVEDENGTTANSSVHAYPICAN